jgi:DtxR family transcriptional regulator, Mn-dependent transcriptional regulator
MRTKKVGTIAITATKEDYVRAIFILALVLDDVGVTNIAKRLGLSKSTVSERIKELVESKLVVSAPYGKVQLTKEGFEVGKKLTYKHRIIEVFLHNTLHIPKDKIHAEAERLEHAFSDDVIKRLANFLGNPANDPHGSTIPKNIAWNFKESTKKEIK